MPEHAFLSALADYNAEYWWARAALTLAVVWLFIDLARDAPWAQAGLKISLALTSITVGVLFYGLFLPATLPRDVPAAYRIWLHSAGSAGLIIAGLAGITDAARNGTVFVIPDRGWRLVAILAGVVIGLGFPAFELLMRHVYPEAQSYGVAPAPLVLVVLPLLGASRPRRWTGRIWFWLTILVGVELGLVAPLLGLPHGQPIALVASVVALVMWLRPNRAAPVHEKHARETGAS